MGVLLVVFHAVLPTVHTHPVALTTPWLSPDACELWYSTECRAKGTPHPRWLCTNLTEG